MSWLIAPDTGQKLNSSTSWLVATISRKKKNTNFPRLYVKSNPKVIYFSDQNSGNQGNQKNPDQNFSPLYMKMHLKENNSTLSLHYVMKFAKIGHN